MWDHSSYSRDGVSYRSCTTPKTVAVLVGIARNLVGTNSRDSVDPMKYISLVFLKALLCVNKPPQVLTVCFRGEGLWEILGMYWSQLEKG